MVLAAHAGQTRIGSGLPYVTHPISVALAVAARGGTEEEIIAAIFHDAVEDTIVTLKQVRRGFGDGVADLVATVTKDEELTKMENVRKIARSGLKGTRLKMDDSRHNMSDLDPTSDLYAFYEKSMQVLETAEEIYLAAEVNS